MKSTANMFIPVVEQGAHNNILVVVVGSTGFEGVTEHFAASNRDQIVLNKLNGTDKNKHENPQIVGPRPPTC